jgi:hypothetical protein
MERLVALVLREEGEAPGEANHLASKIVSRIEASQSMPVKPGLRGYRMIPESLPFEKRDEFTDDVARHLDDVDYDTARTLWELVYKYGRNVPDDIVM